MKRLSLVAILMAVATAAWAVDPPELINYKGVLRNADDSPRSGSHDMVFHFFDAETGGTELMTEAHTASGGHAVPVSGGLFDVQLGSGVITGPGTYMTLSSLFRDHGEVWLEVQVESEVLSPRVQILASAFALNADRLDGNDASVFLEGMDTAGHASLTPVLFGESALDCTSGDFPPACEPIRTVLARVPEGSEVEVGAKTPTDWPLEITLTGHDMPVPPDLPDSCHPGVEVYTEFDGGTLTLCIAPSHPVAHDYIIGATGVLYVRCAIHPGSWVSVEFMDLEGVLTGSTMASMRTESDGAIVVAPVTYLPDGSARVEVSMMNNGPVRTSYLVSIENCTATCTEPPPRAQSIIMDPIPFHMESLSFDLPPCGGATGTNSCTVFQRSTTGRVYDSVNINF